MIRHLALSTLALFLLGGLHAHPRGEVSWDKSPIPVDTTIWVDEVAIHGRSLKQGRLPMAISPVSASIFTEEEGDRLHLVAPKDLSILVPNLLIPDYGSRMTSSIYIRGLGARIDQPAMGLTVDNIPILNKDTYDFDMTEIARTEVLRGPQSTLYGRNTIGGVMNITTRSALEYEGAEAELSYASGTDFSARLSSHFHAWEGEHSTLGIGLSAHYGSMKGLFTNDFTGEKCDWNRRGGGSVRIGWQNDRGWRIDNLLMGAYLKQGGYPYRSVEAGDIAYNDPCGYERTSLLEGLRIRYKRRVEIESITSYQLLDDRMDLDQDFRPESYFTLTQDRREHAFTEEIILRPSQPKQSWYSWMTGAFGFGKFTDMAAPVNFKEQGLQELIIDNVKHYTGLTPHFSAVPFPLDSNFDIHTWGAALYHESYFTPGRWLITLGLRLDHEESTMAYASATRYNCSIGRKEIPPFTLQGKLKHDFTEWLPKFSVLYHLGANRLSTLYLSVSKGYKAGGFNTQMFSDVLQAKLMSEMGASFDRHYDIRKVVQYDPEESWNYEVGGHFHLIHGDLKLDWALFFIDCRNQQLTIFPPGQTTGRMMTNAGQTHSYGAELTASIAPTRYWRIDASYGFTHATFSEYHNGREDLSGNRLPYAPAHTLSVRMSYDWMINRSWLERIVPMVDLRGAGDIWWNEENSLRQPFYSLLSATLRFEHRHFTLDLWGKNLLNERYDLFYFKSIGREFVQQGLPRTWGATLTLKL